MTKRKYKIAILNSHPIQYFGPLYSYLSSIENIDLNVFYYSKKGLEPYYDEGFEKNIQWDVDLTEGYTSNFLSEISDSWIIIYYKIMKILWVNKYDALIIHGTNSFIDISAIFLSKFLPTITMMRRDTHIKSYNKKGRIKTFIQKKINRMINVNLSISERHDEFFLTHGANEKSIFRMPFPVNNEYFIRNSTLTIIQKNYIKQSLDIDSQNIVILYASKFSKQKRPLDLLKAVHLINDDKTTLLFVGSGEEEANLKAYVEKNKIKNVKFLGFKNQSELPGLYAISDIFVLPSEREPWGLVVNEAMCAGLPVITTKQVGAVPEIVKHGETGFTYNSGDINQLSNYLSLLLEDDELRRRMGRNALAFISGYNYELFSQQLLNIMEQVTRKR